MFGVQWLQTDMGTVTADLPVEGGAKAALDKISQVTTKADNGTFLNNHVPGWGRRSRCEPVRREEPALVKLFAQCICRKSVCPVLRKKRRLSLGWKNRLTTIQ